MKIENEKNALRVTEVVELNATNAQAFRDEVCAALPPNINLIEIDLSQAKAIDRVAAMTLCEMYARVNRCREAGDEVTICLHNTDEPTWKLFELLQLKELFTITKQNPAETK